MRKFLCTATAAVMTAVMLCSCTGDTGGEASKIDTGLNSDAATGEITVENNCYSAGLPIAEKTVEFQIMIKDDSGGLCNYETMALNQWMKDNMNIEVEWLTCPGGWEVNNMMTLAYVSNNLPDIFMGMAPTGYSFQWEYIEEGKVQELNELIKKYGPNIMKMFNEVPASEYLCTGYDGKIYFLPMVWTGEETQRFAGQLYINQTWLDALGLTMPKTTAEFKRVLQMFKNNDPNGNGLSDEIPLTLGEDLPNGLYGAFGLPVYYNLLYVDDSDKVHFAPVENNYRRCLTYYAGLYQEGLIDKDFYSQNNQDIATKVNSAVATVGAFVVDGSTSLADVERAAEYSVVPPLSDDEGNCTWTNQVRESCYPEWFVVTSACEYPEIAVRMADYFYSVEGSYVALYGPPGEDNLWYVNDDGKVVFTDRDNMNTRKFDYTPGYPLPAFRGSEFIAAQAEISESEMSEKEKLIKQNKELTIEYYTPVIPDKVLYNTNIALDDLRDYNMISSDMGQNATWRKEFLLGQRNIDTEWDAYISFMERAGVDRYIEIWQNSYNAYLAWMNS